ncbi:MAG: MATE family efflux transporter [Candidatus Obscuribacterales bacterium]|nr:MATE family efflux transporter [Candidatus Obscuribacterales bacterium]
MPQRPTREMAWALGAAAQTQEYVKGRTVLTGSIKRSIWKISWPLLLVSACTAVIDLYHVQCAGHISAGSQAIIGICDQILSLGYILIAGLASSASAFVSRAAGQEDEPAILQTSAQCLVLCLLLGFILSFLILSFGRNALIPFSGCVDDCTNTLSGGTQYLAVASFTLIPFAILSAVNSCFMGLAQGRVQLVSMLTLTAFDILLNYLLVFCSWPVSGLGIQAIAISTLIAYSLSALIALIFLFSSRLKSCLSSLLQKEFSLAISIAKSGLPPALQEMAWTAGAFVLYLILGMADDSTQVVAALNVGQRLESFAFVPLSALATALLVICGQNLGAGRNDRARKSSMLALFLGSALMLLAGITFFVFAENLALSCQASVQTVPHIAAYLRIAALGLAFVGFETILSGPLQALDDTKILLIAGFVSNWLLCLPLAYLLAITLSLGSLGVFYAILAANLVSGLIILLRFLSRPQWRSAGNSALEPAPALRWQTSTLSQDSLSEPVSRGRPCVELQKPSLEPEHDENEPL